MVKQRRAPDTGVSGRLGPDCQELQSRSTLSCRICHKEASERR